MTELVFHLITPHVAAIIEYMLTDLPIPGLTPGQLDLFTRETLLTRETGHLSVTALIDDLRTAENRRVWAVDIGGTALKYAPSQIHGGLPIIDEQQCLTVQIEGTGENYLEALTTLSGKTGSNPVGISTAGVLSDDGNIENPNTAAFAAALRQAGGFPALFDGHYHVVNDAVAGLVAGAAGVALRGTTFRSAMCVINGGGIGGAVMAADGTVLAAEPGLTPVIGELNPQHIPGRRNVNGQTYACVEQVGAMAHGVEPQWKLLTGQTLPAKDIAGKLEEGDTRAVEIFDRAALVTAHVIVGMRQAFGLPWRDTAVILHGGGFRTDMFFRRVEQIVRQAAGEDVHLFSAYALGFDDVCLSGAAMMSLA